MLSLSCLPCVFECVCVCVSVCVCVRSLLSFRSNFSGGPSVLRQLICVCRVSCVRYTVSSDNTLTYIRCCHSLFFGLFFLSVFPCLSQCLFHSLSLFYLSLSVWLF